MLENNIDYVADHGRFDKTRLTVVIVGDNIIDL